LWRAEASRLTLRVCHDHTLRTLEKFLITFNPPWLNSTLTKFEAGNIKSVGEFDQMRGVEKGKTALICTFNKKWPTSCGPGAMMSRGFSCVSGVDEDVYQISPANTKLSTMAGVFRKFVGGATEPFSSGYTQYSLHTYEVISMDMCAKCHDLAMLTSLLTHKRHNTIFAAPPRPHPSDFGKVDHNF